jgi:hypothetical protein
MRGRRQRGLPTARIRSEPGRANPGDRVEREGGLAHSTLRGGRRRSWNRAARLPPHVRKAGPRCWRELEQIQMLLGHAPVQTTERYLETKQGPCA